MAKKTIIVGIGTEGYLVAELVARRLTTKYGDISKAPWVRFLIVDTENPNTKPLGKKKVTSHIGISQDDFLRIRNHPHEFDQSMDLTAWAGDCTQFGDAAPTKGAANIRPLGRLCFLFPTNFVEFCTNIQLATHDLINLTEAKVKQDCGVEVEFSQEFGQDRIQVFVIATTTGGTGSGSFIDVGETLRNMDILKGRSEVHGLISIPAKGHANAIHNANAFMALKELSHFHYPTERYHAKLPSPSHFPGGGLDLRSSPPFDHTIILQPMASDTYGLEVLRRMVAEYIALSATGPLVDALGAKLVDTAALGVDFEDGRPMRFAGIGVSTIEYPAEYIAEGIFMGLLRDACDQFRAPAETMNFEEIKRLLKVSQEEVSNRFVESPAGQRLMEDWMRKAEQAAQSLRRKDEGPLEKFLHEVQRGLNRDSVELHEWQSFAGKYGPDLVQVGMTLGDDMARAVREGLARIIATPGQGVEHCVAAIDGLQEYIAKRLQDIRSPQTDIGIRAEASSTYHHLRNYFSGKQGCNPFAKKPDPNGFVQNAGYAARVSLRLYSEIPEHVALERVRTELVTMRERVAGHPNGARKWLMSLRDFAAARHLEVDQNKPVVNGHVFYEPNRTLADETQRLFPSETHRQSAVAELAGPLGSILAEAFADPSRFEFAAPPADDDATALRSRVSTLLQPIYRRSVLDLLASTPNMEMIVQDAISKSKPWIDIQWNRNPLGAPSPGQPNRNPLIFACEGADNPEPTGPLKMVRDMLPGNWMRRGADDPTRLYFIQAHTMFSLYSITSVQSWKPLEDPKKHTRMDIAWRKLNGDPKDPFLSYNVGMLLTGLVAKGPNGKTVVRRALNGLEFDLPAGPTRPAGVLSLPADLEEASYMLSHRYELEASILREQLESAIRADSRAFAEALKDFIHHADRMELKYAGETLNGDKGREEIFNRMYGFLRQYPDVMQAYLALFPDWRPPTIRDYRNENGFVICPHCKKELAWKEDSDDSVPDTCPVCGWRLKFDVLRAS